MAHKFETVLTVVNSWTVSEYSKPRPIRQRLGQWLMNRLEPSTVDPVIFYEEDDTKAFTLFRDKYCVAPQDTCEDECEVGNCTCEEK